MYCFYFCVDVVWILKLASSTQDAHDQFILVTHLKLIVFSNSEKKKTTFKYNNDNSYFRVTETSS